MNHYEGPDFPPTAQEKLLTYLQDVLTTYSQLQKTYTALCDQYAALWHAADMALYANDTDLPHCLQQLKQAVTEGAQWRNFYE